MLKEFYPLSKRRWRLLLFLLQNRSIKPETSLLINENQEHIVFGGDRILV